MSKRSAIEDQVTAIVDTVQRFQSALFELEPEIDPIEISEQLQEQVEELAALVDVHIEESS